MLTKPDKGYVNIILTANLTELMFDLANKANFSGMKKKKSPT